MVSIGEWILPFGKYKGLTYGEVKEKDIKYLQYLTEQDWYKYAAALKSFIGSIEVKERSKFDTMPRKDLIDLVTELEAKLEQYEPVSE